jgi:AraC-like DNA-binding protein
VNAEFVGLCRNIVSPNFMPAAVSFAHPKPPSTAVHDEHFGMAVSFDQPRTEVVIPKALLDVPMPKADPAFARYFVGEADRRLARLGGPSVSASVRRILMQSRPATTMHTVARELGMSRRTLHRRLREEGTTFDAVVATTRHALALEYVTGQAVPFAEVAYLLGFSGPSAFHRAFKRWTGLTPRDYRRMRQASG